MVLHRVLAMSARTFLLNDLGDEPADDRGRTGTVDALTLSMGTRPLWAQSAGGSLKGTERRPDRTERIHQSRVAMRRIRSNLRTFRLLLDPGWGTALRAELAWYGNALGHSRDLDLLATLVDEHGPEVLDRTEVARLGAVIGWQRQEVERELASEQAGPRRIQLTEQMMVLWEGPAFKSKAAKPASEVLPAMLHRSWRDLRGAARTARKDPSDVHLHQLRIRLKDLRYGAETVALVEGARPARRRGRPNGSRANSAACTTWSSPSPGSRRWPRSSPNWPTPPSAWWPRSASVPQEARKGWKKDLKEVERRWRRWQG